MGKLYGVGVGPGDPELMTIKAARYISSADIICLPKAEKETCRAYMIAKQIVPEIEEKECICCDFKMIRDPEKKRRMHQDIYMTLKPYLEDGRDVAFLTIGDPTTYSTFSYIFELAKNDGFETGLISGVTSYNAVAASLGIVLCEGDEELHIGTAKSNLEQFADLPGTRIIMKSGRGLRAVKDTLREAEHRSEISVYAVSDCGLPDEKQYFGADEIPENGEYMTTIIIKGESHDI